jgi:uncharacterized membrane protein
MCVVGVGSRFQHVLQLWKFHLKWCSIIVMCFVLFWVHILSNPNSSDPESLTNNLGLSVDISEQTQSAGCDQNKV